MIDVCCRTLSSHDSKMKADNIVCRIFFFYGVWCFMHVSIYHHHKFNIFLFFSLLGIDLSFENGMENDAVQWHLYLRWRLELIERKKKERNETKELRVLMINLRVWTKFNVHKIQIGQYVQNVLIYIIYANTIPSPIVQMSAMEMLIAADAILSFAAEWNDFNKTIITCTHRTQPLYVSHRYQYALKWLFFLCSNVICFFHSIRSIELPQNWAWRFYCFFFFYFFTKARHRTTFFSFVGSFVVKMFYNFFSFFDIRYMYSMLLNLIEQIKTSEIVRSMVLCTNTVL